MRIGFAPAEREDEARAAARGFAPSMRWTCPVQCCAVRREVWEVGGGGGGDSADDGAAIVNHCVGGQNRTGEKMASKEKMVERSG
jgi:hypothetical protein